MARGEFTRIIGKLPLAYNDVTALFRSLEKQSPGNGRIFSIFVSDLCKGCGECASECGEKDALVMRPETEDINADHVSGINFLDLLPDTPTGGTCETAPAAITLRVFEADGTTPVSGVLIEDTDYSAETTALAKSQILSQASSAMLAQANQSQQNVLSLLR